MIGVEFGRDARDRLTAQGSTCSTARRPMSHTIDPEFIPELQGWLAARIPVAGA